MDKLEVKGDMLDVDVETQINQSSLEETPARIDHEKLDATQEAASHDGQIFASVLGCVASPARYESTSKHYYFWVRSEKLVEATQLVQTASCVSGRLIEFYGMIEEVSRSSGRHSFSEEKDGKDGDPYYEPPFKPEGTTYCEVTILRADPPYMTPPLEESLVFLGRAAAAAKAYDYESMDDPENDANWGLPIGLLRNGGMDMSGAALIDIRDLCGQRAGHLNVTGQAGHGTKSSFLLVIVKSLIEFAHRWDNGDANRERFSVRPIVFNVKGNDLMFIDEPNRYLSEKHSNRWGEMGVEPQPFVNAEFYSPCAGGKDDVSRAVARVQRSVPSSRQTHAYYWTLADVIRFGLWSYLFSEDAQQSETMAALADHILDVIAEDCQPDDDHPAGLQLRQPGSGPNPQCTPQSFSELTEELRSALRNNQHPLRDSNIHAFGTTRALLSRLGVIRSAEGRLIFDDGRGCGTPLRVLARGTTDPMVIDIAGLPVELRRFVVAAVLDQVKERQMGPKHIQGQVYVLVLDELGVYAPRGARDPITKLFEHVAAQLRSQGIILFSAQQQASKVSETIFGNSEFKAIGATSSDELDTPTWNRLLTTTQKARSLQLHPEEKMVRTQRGWMNVIVPFPAWAMKQSEIGTLNRKSPVGEAPVDKAPGTGFPLNLPDDA